MTNMNDQVIVAWGLLNKKSGNLQPIAFDRKSEAEYNKNEDEQVVRVEIRQQDSK